MTDLIKLCESILLAPYTNNGPKAYKASDTSTPSDVAGDDAETPASRPIPRRVPCWCSGGYVVTRSGETEHEERCTYCNGLGYVWTD